MEDHNGNNAESAAAKAGATSASGDTYYARTENSVSWTIPVDATSSLPSYNEVELSEMNARNINEPEVLCIVSDETDNRSTKRHAITLSQSTDINTLYQTAAKEFGYEEGSFLLVYNRNNIEETLGENSTATLFEMQIPARPARNTFYIREKDDTGPPKKIGPSGRLDNASSSTMTSQYTAMVSGPRFCGLVNQAMTCYLNSLLQTLFMAPEFRNAIYRFEFKDPERSSTDKLVKNIPFQLQRLFLKLQTSERSAVETTDITKSFGWDSSEAWQQHDVQELCRVMFDALETKLKGKEGKDMINQLYQGKMKDYVKCLECESESFRTDSFLDIPLSIKPFGSETALESVEESLKSFVAPETLSGDNQYFCDKCKKKCDAHKGLKFSHFPYLLTLQLKRFDLDYQTFQRVKLNDKMSFPRVLDLNPFTSPVESTKEEIKPPKGAGQTTPTTSNPPDSGAEAIKKNDQSPINATNPPVAPPPPPPPTNRSPLTHPGSRDGDQTPGEGDKTLGEVDQTPGEGDKTLGEVDQTPREGGQTSREGDQTPGEEDQKPGEEDQKPGEGDQKPGEGDQTPGEGGSVKNAPESDQFSQGAVALPKSDNKSSRHQQEEDEIQEKLKGGPYVYELFSVMVHSGSALGGHYYAYIKSLKDFQWYCFNDHNVTFATEDDIEKAFGGIHQSRGYYSSIYSSSANAYMLMYRKVSPRNESFMEVEYFPQHLRQLIEEEHIIEKRAVEIEKKQKEMCKLKLFYRDIGAESLTEGRIQIHKDDTLQQAVVEAHRIAGYGKKIPVEQCRLVRYDDYYELVERSWEGKEELTVSNVFGGVKTYYTFELLLETREEGEEFPRYQESEIVIKFRTVDADISEPHRAISNTSHIRLMPTLTIREMKDKIAQRIGMDDPIHLLVLWEKYHSDLIYLDTDDMTLKETGFHKRTRLFVQKQPYTSDHAGIQDSQFWRHIDEYLHMIKVLVFLDEDFPSMARNPVDGGIEKLVDGEPSFTIHLDKRKTLEELKRQMGEKLQFEPINFKLYRIYGNYQEFEMTRLQDSLQSNPDEIKVVVRKGRALQTDEWRVKVFQLDMLQTEYSKELLDIIVGKGMTVLEIKKEILKLLQDKEEFKDFPLDRFRLRKKQWRNPGFIYLNEMKVSKDFQLFVNFELFVELLRETEKLESVSHIQMYVRRWRPSEYKVDQVGEVILTNTSMDELKYRISLASGIPKERVEIAKGYGTFPHETSVLDIHKDLNWNPNCENVSGSPLFFTSDGSMIFYRDSAEELKELSKEELEEIKKAEQERLSKYQTSTSTISNSRMFHRKEKALKIYTDEDDISADKVVSEKSETLNEVD